MDWHGFFQALQDSPLAHFINTAGATYPIVESLHVIAIALVFGSIFVVDLRLLGLASTVRPFTGVARDLLRCTWCGFALAVVTGVLLFLPNASNLYSNAPFLTKMALLGAAGLNMLVFELITVRRVSIWDSLHPPVEAKLAGLLSILLWTGVIVAGRLIGFTSVADDPFSYI